LEPTHIQKENRHVCTGNQKKGGNQKEAGNQKETGNQKEAGSQKEIENQKEAGNQKETGSQKEIENQKETRNQKETGSQKEAGSQKQAEPDILLEWIPENRQTEEVCLRAVKQDGIQIGYVKNRTDRVCRAAVKRLYQQYPADMANVLIRMLGLYQYRTV
jgi:hypothetical protein